MEGPLFPVGPFDPPSEFTEAQKNHYLQQLQQAPARARQSIEGLDEAQLDTKYRNWTIRQIIHHLADSHINCYVRFKWALT